MIVNRKTRKDPIVLDNPFVSVTRCLPPDVLPDLSDERGREDGFVHRILFSYPDSIPQAWTDNAIDPRYLERFSELFQNLWSLEPEKDEHEQPRAHILRLSAAARTSWRDWLTAHYAEQSREDFPDHLRAPWAKMEGYCSRLALIVYCCRVAVGEDLDKEIDEESITAAWALIDYFKSHARRVYSRLHTSPADRRAEAALNWIKKHGEKVTARDLLRNNVAGVKTSTEAQKLLADLIDRGYGKIAKEGNREVFTLYQPDTRHFEENEENTNI